MVPLRRVSEDLCFTCVTFLVRTYYFYSSTFEIYAVSTLNLSHKGFKVSSFFYPKATNYSNID